MNNKNTAIKKAIACFGGTQAELARILNVSRSQVWQWLNNTNSVSIEKAIAIEEKTKGRVRCEDVRPDINWSVLRNKKATSSN